MRKISMTTPIDYVFCSGYLLEKVKLILLHIPTLLIQNSIKLNDIFYRTKIFTLSSNQKSCRPSYLM